MTLEHKNIVRHNDEYICTACGKSWDINDPEPPECNAVRYQSAPVRNIQNLPREGMPFGGIPPECDAVRHQSAPIKLHNLKSHTLQKTPSGDHVYNFGEREGTEGVVSFSKDMSADDNLAKFRTAFPQTHAVWEEMEARCIAAATQGWPTPDSPLSAWLVYDAEDPKTALLVYAMNGKAAVKFVNLVLKLHGTLEASRCRSMDECARGFSPYVDANPANRNKAEKAARCKVISLLEWQR